MTDESEEITRFQAIAAIAAIVGGIALILPFTPSKTGGNTRIAYVFFSEPTYWHEVLVNLVLGSVLLAILILIARIMTKRDVRAAARDQSGP